MKNVNILIMSLLIGLAGSMQAMGSQVIASARAAATRYATQAVGISRSTASMPQFMASRMPNAAHFLPSRVTSSYSKGSLAPRFNAFKQNNNDRKTLFMGAACVAAAGCLWGVGKVYAHENVSESMSEQRPKELTEDKAKGLSEGELSNKVMAKEKVASKLQVGQIVSAAGLSGLRTTAGVTNNASFGLIRALGLEMKDAHMGLPTGVFEREHGINRATQKIALKRASKDDSFLEVLKKNQAKIEKQEHYDDLREKFSEGVPGYSWEKFSKNFVSEVPKAMFKGAVVNAVSQLTDNHYGKIVLSNVALQAVNPQGKTYRQQFNHGAKAAFKGVVVDVASEKISQAITNQVSTRVAPLLPTRIANPQEDSAEAWLVWGGRQLLNIGVKVGVGSMYDAATSKLDPHTRKIGFSLKFGN